MDPMIDIGDLTCHSIRSHTRRLACMAASIILHLSSHGAGGPGHPAPPACGRCRLARSAHSTSPLECRRPVCHHRCRPRPRPRPPSPSPRPRPRPGQHSRRLLAAARRELRPPLRRRRRRSAPAGCRPQCRREPCVERTENVGRRSMRSRTDVCARVKSCWSVRVYCVSVSCPVMARCRPLFIGPMGWSHGHGAAAVTKQTFVWRARPGVFVDNWWVVWFRW